MAAAHHSEKECGANSRNVYLKVNSFLHTVLISYLLGVLECVTDHCGAEHILHSRSEFIIVTHQGESSTSLRLTNLST